jgi:choline-sulfatase
MPTQPNVLVLMNDEHRPDVAGFAGDDVVRTPTLDRLAETGTVFTNAYTPAPVCVPARHAIRSGKLPRTFARDGFDAFESTDYETLPRRLGKHGYMTVQSGKEHYPGFAQMQGWRKRLGPTPLKRAIGDDVEQMADPHESDGESGLGKWSGATELARAGVADSRVQVGDRRAVEATEQFVKQYFSSPHYDRASPDRPLLLKTSLIQPHYPFFTEYEDRFTYYLNRVDPYVEEPLGVHPVVSEARTKGNAGSSRLARTSPNGRFAGPPPRTTRWSRRSTNCSGGCSMPSNTTARTSTSGWSCSRPTTVNSSASGVCGGKDSSSSPAPACR